MIRLGHELSESNTMTDNKRASYCPWARKPGMTYGDILNWVEPSMIPVFDKAYRDAKNGASIKTKRRSRENA